MAHLKTIAKFCLFFVFGYGALLFTTLSYAQAKEPVRVAAYVFPPFLNVDLKSGLTPQLIHLLNKAQEKFHFELVVTSPNRRYNSFKYNSADMIFFEMPEWGWKTSDLDFSSTREIMKGSEVYITANIEGRTQSFFDNISEKSISAFLGYHYGFAGYIADRRYLENNFRINLQNNPARIVQLVSENKVGIGVLSESFLKKFIQSNPDLKNKLLISDKKDQVYSLRCLVNAASPITTETFEALLEDLKENGALMALFKENAIEDQLTF